MRHQAIAPQLAEADLTQTSDFRPFLPSRPGEFHPEPSQIPDVNLSIHPARVTARRLPPSVEQRAPPGEPVGPSPTAMTHPLRSSPITEPSSLLRGSPPLSGASVLSASRWEPLALFPWHRRQVLTFHTRAWSSFALPTRRMPLGRYQDILRADPGRWVNPRF